MRVLLIRNADQSGYGGAEEYVLNLAKELNAVGHYATLVTALPKLQQKASQQGVEWLAGPWLKRQNWHGWRTLLLPIYLIWLVRLTLWYLRCIRRVKPDILHPQNRDDWLASSRAGELTHTPVIWSDHADLKHEVKDTARWNKNWLGKLVVFASRWTSRITVVSEADRREIIPQVKKSLADKLFVVHNGVPDQKATVKAVSKVADVFVFGVTARLQKEKGLYELLEAYQLLLKTHPKIQLWIVGEGPEMAKLKRLSGDIASVKLIGYVENPLDYVAAMDAFVLPTYSEGFSISLLEAAMLGKPVVTTDVGGNPEIIVDNHSGLLVKARDTSDLYKAMKRLIDHPQLAARLGENLRKSYEKKFEISVVVKNKILPIYEEAIR